MPLRAALLRRSLIALVPVAALCAEAAAQQVPLPRPRPATLPLAPTPELKELVYPPPSPGPSACELRLGHVAAFKPLPVLMGPGACGVEDVVQLEAVTMPDKTAVPLNPPAILRCGMAEAVAIWVRQDVGPAALPLGAPLAAIANFDSYDCRGRNRVMGAKMSEHGRGNAIDIRGVRLKNGTTVELTSTAVARDFRERMRTAACARFTTVLGPGSDGYHESHIHLDLAERSRGYRLCQWDVRDPPPPPAAATLAGTAANVPLPQPKPAALIVKKQNLL
jgi:hypothetical protein